MTLLRPLSGRKKTHFGGFFYGVKEGRGLALATFSRFDPAWIFGRARACSRLLRRPFGSTCFGLGFFDHRRFVYPRFAGTCFSASGARSR